MSEQSSTNKESEAKLLLKSPLINYNKKPIKDNSNLQELIKQNPGIFHADLIEKCPDATIGEALIQLLLTVPTSDNVERLKLFRWASKIEDKMVTNKGELVLDLNQVTELFGFVSKVQSANIITIAPVLIQLEDLKNKLK